MYPSAATEDHNVLLAFAILILSGTFFVMFISAPNPLLFLVSIYTGIVSETVNSIIILIILYLFWKKLHAIEQKLDQILDRTT